MVEKVTLPNLQEAEILIGDLFDEVKKWEGTLSGGTQLGVGATAIDSLLHTKVSFGNPRDDLTFLTKKLFEEFGVELTSIQKRQMRNEYDFYYMTITVNIRPKPGAQFKMLCCTLDFGPKGEKEPTVQAIFPESKWRTVMNWGGSMNLGLNANLDWGIGVDSSKVGEIVNLPSDLQMNVANKNDLNAFITIDDYAYEVGRFDIAAYGKNSSECYWYIHEPDLQKLLSVQFTTVFKVPIGTDSITLHGIAWAEPSMNWLVENIDNVFRDLKDKIKVLLQSNNETANKFARGTAEEWTLILPRKT